MAYSTYIHIRRELIIFKIPEKIPKGCKLFFLSQYSIILPFLIYINILGFIKLVFSIWPVLSKGVTPIPFILH